MSDRQSSPHMPGAATSPIVACSPDGRGAVYSRRSLSVSKCAACYDTGSPSGKEAALLQTPSPQNRTCPSQDIRLKHITNNTVPFSLPVLIVEQLCFHLSTAHGRCTAGNRAWLVRSWHEFVDDRGDEPVPDCRSYLCLPWIVPEDDEPEVLRH